MVTGPKADMQETDISDVQPADMDAGAAREKIDSLSLEDRAKMPQSELLALYAAAEGSERQGSEHDNANPASDDFSPGRGPAVEAAADQAMGESDEPADSNELRTRINNILAKRGAADEQTVEALANFASSAGFSSVEASALFSNLMDETQAASPQDAEQIALSRDPVLSQLSEAQQSEALQAAAKMIRENETLQQFAASNQQLFSYPSLVGKLARKAITQGGKK
jgi:hypothetical protein